MTQELFVVDNLLKRKEICLCLCVLCFDLACNSPI